MSVTFAQGFSAGSTTASIKPSGAADMAVIINHGPQHAAAGVFTRNKVFAAPVRASREALNNGELRAVVVNSGNANACTGEQGLSDAHSMQSQVAKLIDAPASDVAVASTGLIGDLLPMDAINNAIAPLVAAADTTAEAAKAAAAAIMTTDTVPKAAQIEGPGGFRVGAMGKGVGMMAPSLATMLVFVTTDAAASAKQLQNSLNKAVAETFNTLDIDGVTSTNDTVIVMASGASGVEPTPADLDAAIFEVCSFIAAQMQADAEGVTKRVQVQVTGTTDDDHALRAARTVARDNLFKCAMFGSDPNWGRVLAAVGMADADMDAEGIAVSFNGHPVCEKSTAVPGARDVDLSGRDIDVVIDLGLEGPGAATVRTTDLSHAYVEINSAYSS